MGYILCFLGACFQVDFCIDFCGEFMEVALKTGLRKESIAKTMFSQKSLFDDSRVVVCVFLGGLGSSFSDFDL